MLRKRKRKHNLGASSIVQNADSQRITTMHGINAMRIVSSNKLRYPTDNAQSYENKLKEKKKKGKSLKV